ncbi:MAG: outer membrane lipoprotein-sorting protein [Bacteroidales bacterium]|nr:outer membrane lipoprotein-sorting protein [Bacteroidales bacterium]
MKTLKLSVLVCALVTLTSTINYVKSQDAVQILKQMDDVMYAPKDQDSKIKLVLIDKNDKEKTREATVSQKGTDKRLFKFTSPSSQAGISFLSLPDDVMYLYLPAFGKERRIASHIKNQKFAGTDFSYDDMEAKPYSDKYTPKLLNTEDDIYLLALTPKANIKTDYSKLIVTINKSNYYPTKIEYYDKTGRKIKELNNKEIEKVDGYWVSKEMTMTDLKKNHKTKMIITTVSYDNNLSDDEFTVRKLKQ